MNKNKIHQIKLEFIQHGEHGTVQDKLIQTYHWSTATV